MLLSLYASYHWAKLSKKAYVQRTAILVILVSLLSVYSVLPFGWLFFFAFPVPSFPFYAYVAKLYVDPPLYLEEFRGIRFLTIGGLVATQFILAFSFFLLVNLFGVVLGYGTSKIPRILEWGTSADWNFLGFISGLVFIAVGSIVGYTTPTIEWGEVPFGLESGLNALDGLALFLFGILVLAIVIGRILRSKMSETP